MTCNMIFATLYDEISQDRNLTSTDKILLPTIINLDNKKRCTASNSYLASICRVCENSITNSIKRLEELSYIKVKRTKNSRVIMCCKKFKKVFSMLFRDLLNDDRLDATDKVVLSVICNLDNEKHCTASDRYLSERCGMSEKTIKRTVKKLESLGYIEIDHDGSTRIISCLKDFETEEDKKEKMNWLKRQLNKKRAAQSKKATKSNRSTNLSGSYIYNNIYNSKDCSNIEKKNQTKNSSTTENNNPILKNNTNGINSVNQFTDSQVTNYFNYNNIIYNIIELEYKRNNNISLTDEECDALHAYKLKIEAQKRSQLISEGKKSFKSSIQSAMELLKLHLAPTDWLYQEDTKNSALFKKAKEKIIYCAESFARKYFEKFGKKHPTLSIVKYKSKWTSDNEAFRNSAAFKAISGLLGSRSKNCIANIEDIDIDRMIDRYFATDFYYNDYSYDYHFNHFACFGIWSRKLKEVEHIFYNDEFSYNIYPLPDGVISKAQEKKNAEILEYEIKEGYWSD